MEDPLLLTFALRHRKPPAHGPFLYDIGSGLQPISIRDQMFRANTLVERILSAQIINEGQADPILVIGGGIAGVMTAMTAISHKIPVVLVEREQLCVRQIHSQGRIICPTQYDWPAPHWTAGVYPLTQSKMPLSWKAGYAAPVLAAWNSKLNGAQEKGPRLLHSKTKTIFKSFELLETQGLIKVDSDPPIDDLFRVAIACAGFGGEKTTLPEATPRYKGYAFWQNDPYEKKNLGLGKDQKPRVIICGGGDGALQDFLRIVTGTYAGEIYREIYQSLPEQVQTSTEKSILMAEDNAARTFLWSTVGVLDHEIHQQLQDEHKKVVKTLFEDVLSSEPISRVLAKFIGDYKNRMTLKLAYPCDHFSSCYALNRFLVLLISKYLEIDFQAQVLEPNTKVVDISNLSSHKCESPAACHGKDHELSGATATCSNFHQAGTSRAQLQPISGGPYNVVVVRHGVKFPNPPLGERASANPYRQTIPYSTPW